MRRIGSAERLIRGEAIRFMQQQRSDEQRSEWAMVLYEQPDEIPQPEPEPSSSEPPPSVAGQNIIEEIMMKYGLKRQNHPPIVIAKPIPPPKSTSAPPPPVVPPSEPTSAPPPPLLQQSDIADQGRSPVSKRVLVLLNLLRVKRNLVVTLGIMSQRGYLK